MYMGAWTQDVGPGGSARVPQINIRAKANCGIYASGLKGC